MGTFVFAREGVKMSDNAAELEGKTTKIFVGNLSFQSQERDLSDFFSSCGEVVDSRVISDRNTGRSKGFGFVTFSSPDGPVEAKKLTGQDLQGREIRVEFASENPPKRDRPAYGDRDRGYDRRGDDRRGDDRRERHDDREERRPRSHSR